MGDDTSTSAVNNYLQMWGMKILFVVSGSAFLQFWELHAVGALVDRAVEYYEYLNNEGRILTEAKNKIICYLNNLHLLTDRTN